MKNFTRKIPDKSRTGKTNRWLGWLTFSLMLLLGQFTWGQGQTCNNPLVISSIPFNASGNTSSYGSNYSSGDVPPAAPGVTTPSSSYLGGDDVVFSISPLINGEITLTASNLGTWSGMYVFTGCPFTLTVGHITGSAGGTKEISDLVVTAGETYYIVISTWPSPQSTDFTLDVTGTPGLLTPLTNCTGTPDGGIASLTPSGGNAGSTFMAKATDVSIAIGMEYQWQKFVGGAWVDIAGATTINSPITAESSVVGTTTDYRLKVTCTTSNQTAYSTVASYTIQLVYCTPTGASNNSDEIRNFTLNNLDNDSAASEGIAGYSDYSNSVAPAEVYAGVPTEASLTSGTGSGNHGAAIWIDYNQNGTFEAIEKVTFIGSSIAGGATATFPSFTVPPSTPEGIYRLRVQYRFNISGEDLDPCVASQFAETEDYAVEVIHLDDCIGTPSAGTVTSPIYVCSGDDFVLTTLGATAPAGGLEGIWQSSPAGMNDWVDVVGAISTTHVMSAGVTSNTDFRYKLTCTNSNETDISGTISVLMNDAIDCYCIPVGTSTTNYITGFSTTGGTVNISNVDNGLSAGGYGDFFLFHNLTQEIGDSVDFEVTTFGTATSGLKIWVDWNQNGSFDDDGELVFATTAYANIHTGSFVVSNTALEGQTRMRIGNASSTTTGPTTPCLTNLSGEYEDYMLTVYVPVCAKPFDLALDAITPNSATISWTSTGSLFDIELGEEGFFQSGIPTTSGVTNPHTINGLDSSTTYEFYVRQDCGADGYSNWAGPFSFTTECLPPSITETTGDTICGEGEANLTVVTDGDVVSWYTSETGGIKIGSGATFTTPLNTETTSYYAEAGFIVPNVTAQVGTATTTSSSSGSSPYYHGWGGVKTQYIYKVEELIAAGLNSGPITSIAFDVTSTGSNLADFTVHIGTTTQELATATHVSGLTLVYSNANQATTVGLNTYSLTGTFVWDGISNIVVQTSFSNVNTGGTSASTRYHAPGSNLTTYTYADNRTAQQILDTMTGAVSNGSGTSGGTSTSTSRANIYINGNGICASEREEVVVTVTAAPDFELSQTTLEICEGDTSDAVTITTGASDYDTFEWTPSLGVSGDATTGWSFDPTETTTYVLTASQSAGAGCVTTFEVQVNVNPLPTVITVVASETEVCDDTIVALSVTGNINNGIAILGNGTTAPGATAWPNPLSTWFGGTKHQMLYTAAELSAQGMMAGSEISAVTFDIEAVHATNGVCVDFTIRMGATTVNEMTELVSGTTTVYGPNTFTPHTIGVGLASFTLTTPYVWDGVSNLVVETVHNSGNSGNGSGTRTKATSTPSNSVAYIRADNVSGGIAGFDALTTTPTYAAQRPNMTFTYTLEQTAITWVPATNLYTDASATTAYVADDYATTVYFKGDTVGTVTYTATSHTDAGCSISDSVELTVNQTPDAPVATSPQLMAEGQTIAEIIVTGDNLTWYTDEDLTDEVDASTVLTEGTYTFYVTDSMGDCTSEATMIVIEVTLSTKDFDAATFKAYPNPVKDYFTISYSKDIQNIAVVNMLGQTIFTKSVNATDTQIDMTALPTGTYFVKVNVDGAVKTIKVAKQ